MHKSCLAGGAIALLLAGCAPAYTTPSRIIILRHGEKADAWRLCKIGNQRALALASTYLGAQASQSLFPGDAPPKSFITLTLHTAETISPSSSSWGKPTVDFSVIPKQNADGSVELLNQRTKEAVQHVFSSPELNGQTVVMVWEHRHIANPALEAKYGAVTLRQLLKLNTLPNVPKKWESQNYNYFWIVDFTPNSRTPSHFSMVKQTFGKNFAGLPSNAWGQPNGLTQNSGCRLPKKEGTKDSEA